MIIDNIIDKNNLTSSNFFDFSGIGFQNDFPRSHYDWLKSVWPFDLIGWLCKLVTINLKTRLIGWISILSRGFVTFDVIISAKITVFSVVVFDYINIRYTVQKRCQNSLCISYTVYDIHYIIMYLSLLWWLVGKLVSFRCWFLLVRIFLFSLK